MNNSMNNDNNIQENSDPDLNIFNRIFPGINSNNNSLYHDYNSLNNSFIKSKNDFALFHLNIRSIFNKMDELLSMISIFKFDFDVICFSESWLDENTKDLVKIPGYKAYHSLRPVGKRGGGISVFVKNCYSSRIMDCYSFNTEYIESLFLEVKLNNKILNIGTVYKPPHANRDLFIEKMSSICHNIGNNNPVFLCGDFNIDILNDDSLSFITMLSSYFLVPVISKPTRITENSISLIDNIFINLPGICYSGILCNDISDHFPIFIMYKNLFDCQPCNTTNSVQYRDVSDLNLELLIRNLENADFDYCDQQENVSEIFHRFYNHIFSAYMSACPIRTKRISYKRIQKPWIDNELLLCIKRRQNLFIQYKQGFISKQSYTRFRNDLTNRIRTAKIKYYEQKFFEYRQNSQKTWSLINDILRPNANGHHIHEIKLRNQTIVDHAKMADVFNEYFSSIGSNIANSIQANGEYLSFMRGNFAESFFMTPTSPQEVFSVTNNLKPKSCDSIRFIPVRVLKAINHLICHPLSKIINNSFTLGIFPDMLKIANVVPIPKQGNSTSIENYRPISLLNVFSKIFEKIVYIRLSRYLEENNILYSKQFGFRSGMSTSDALVTNIIDFYNTLDRGNVIFSLFLDFRKAFDSVDPQILITKLKFYGVRGVACSWFESFLSSRVQYTTVNGVRSGTRMVSHGVPQGSTLGPLLFLVFINDLPNASNLFDFTLFADDCTLTTSFRNIPSTYERQAEIINFELNSLSKWFCENRISINYDKTKHIIFTFGKKINFPIIYINNKIIHQTDSIRFLGAIFLLQFGIQ